MEAGMKILAPICFHLFTISKSPKRLYVMPEVSLNRGV